MVSASVISPLSASGLKHASSAQLEALCIDYPWCEAYQTALARNYYKTGDPRFEGQLNQAAIRIADRETLYDLIHHELEMDYQAEIISHGITPPETNSKQEPLVEAAINKQDQEEILSVKELEDIVPVGFADVPEAKEEADATANTESEIIEEAGFPGDTLKVPLFEDSRINRFPNEEYEERNDPETIFSNSEAHSFSEWLSHFKKEKSNRDKNADKDQKDEDLFPANTEAKTESPKPEDELDLLIRSNSPYDLFGLQKDLSGNQTDQVNQFIGKQIERRRGKHRAEPANLEEEEAHVKLPAEELLTETLAKLYWRQGKREKAILAFKKLALKFPEKSAYFASQIEKIQKER